MSGLDLGDWCSQSWPMGTKPLCKWKFNDGKHATYARIRQSHWAISNSFQSKYGERPTFRCGCPSLWLYGCSLQVHMGAFYESKNMSCHFNHSYGTLSWWPVYSFTPKKLQGWLHGSRVMSGLYWCILSRHVPRLISARKDQTECNWNSF